jgi:hypothetical protein
VGPQLRRQYRGCRRHRDCQQARANVPPSCLPKDQCSSLPAPPNPLQRIPRPTELGRARELIGGLTLASLGHYTTGSTYMMMMMIDGTTRSTSEPGPTLCLNYWMRTVEERVRKENVSELERDVLLAFEGQGSHRLPLPAPPRPPRCSAEPSHPWIDQCRGSTTCKAAEAPLSRHRGSTSHATRDRQVPSSTS